MKQETQAIKEWRESWENSVWECKDTGEQLTILPNMVKMKAFYSFGQCYIDLGDEYYGRFGGNIKRLK